MEKSVAEVRIDKWLWSVRIFKTRSQSSEACRKGRIVIDGVEAKPSRIVKVGDLINYRSTPVQYTYRVKALVNNRQSAGKVPDYCEDITPDQEKDKLLNRNITIFGRRDKGAGRPTKKERRIIDKMGNKE